MASFITLTVFTQGKGVRYQININSILFYHQQSHDTPTFVKVLGESADWKVSESSEQISKLISLAK